MPLSFWFILSSYQSSCVQKHRFALCTCKTSCISKASCCRAIWCKWVFKNGSRCAVQFRVSGCSQESLQRIPEEFSTVSGQLERGITQSCSLSPHHSKNSACLVVPEFWTEADSLQRDSFCCMERSSIFSCRALSVSIQQILRNSSMSEFFFLRDLSEKLFLTSYSPSYLLFASLSLIWTPIRLIQLQSLCFKLLIGFIDNNTGIDVRTSSVLFSELYINLEELVLVPFQGIREDSSTQTEIFLCPC